MLSLPFFATARNPSLRGFAHLVIDPPVIRRGRSGHCCDAALEGVSHHAVVPNVNVMEDVEARITRLSDDEKRLFALICRFYLAAVMPDYEYRQTVVTLQVPVPEQGPKALAEFCAVGRIARFATVGGGTDRCSAGRSACRAGAA